MRVGTVVIVTDSAFVNGGNGKVGLSSAVALSRSGVRTVVFAANGPIASDLREAEGLETICLDQPEFFADRNKARGAVRGLWNFSAATRMKRVLARCDPAETVVHVHSWTKALSSSAIAAAVEAGFPMVLTVHDYFTFCPNGSLYDHARQEPCTLKPMSLQCAAANCDPRSRSQKFYRVVRQMITEWAAGVPARIENFICVSPFSREIARPYLGKRARIYDVANPIDTAREPRADVGANRDVVYVGRLSKEKGVDLFADACAAAGVRGVVVGDGPLGERFRAGAPHLEFTGWLGAAGVRARLRSARALVLPSRWYEAAPLVVPEAAALGVPAIVADRCAAARGIVEGVTGLLFRSGDANDLAAKLRAIDDGALADVLGRAAYERYWQAPPTLDRHVSSLLAAYDDILARSA